MIIDQAELPLGADVREEVAWATQHHTHPAQMVLKRCGKTTNHVAHPYLDEAGLNFGCDGKAPGSRRCPVWPMHDPHVWAISCGGGIYDCAGGAP